MRWVSVNRIALIYIERHYYCTESVKGIFQGSDDYVVKCSVPQLKHVQRLTKRLVRGCDKFVLALA